MVRAVIGPVLRAGIILGWLGVVAWHANGQRLAALGDLRPALREHLDKRLVYHITVEHEGLARAVGSCSWSAHAHAGTTTASYGLELTDLSFIPGIATVMPLLGVHLEPLAAAPSSVSAPASARHLGHAGHPHHALVTVRWEETTTADGDVRSVSGSAHVAGLDGVALVNFHPDGLLVNYSAPGYDGSRSFPALSGVHAVALIALLPTQMRASRRFSVPMVGLDPATFAPRLVHTRFSCTAEEELATNFGVRLLMRVEEQNEEGRLESTLWCDDSGLVYRQRWADPVVQLELESFEPVTPSGPGAAPRKVAN